MKKTIYNTRVHPVTLCHARLEMASNVLYVTLTSRVQSRAEATGPVLAFSEKLDHLFGVGARLAAMALLVMLVERVGTPETTVTPRLGTRVLAPALMKLVLVTLPVILALEARLTRGAPVNVGLSSSTDRGTQRAQRPRDGVRRRQGERCLRSRNGRVGCPRDR